MRLIDADALMDLYANRMVILVEHYGIDSTACGTLSGAMKLLKIQPTLEPKRETGEWKPYTYVDPNDWYQDKEIRYRCSKCSVEVINKSNFCPNCGAAME